MNRSFQVQMIQLFGTHPLADINGVVWLDQNEDGINDFDENGLAGWTIEITDSNGTIVHTFTTSSDGTFAINNVLTGDYTITLLNPDGEIESQDSIRLLADDVFTLLHPVPPESTVAPPIPNTATPVPTLQNGVAFC